MKTALVQSRVCYIWSASLNQMCFIVNYISSLREILGFLYLLLYCLSRRALSYVILISTHLTLCLATAIHNFKWVKITHICII